MRIIYGGRHSGKTTALIKDSAETGIYILVSTARRARILMQQARDLGYPQMPYPVTLAEYFGNKFDGSPIQRRGLFIDDAEDVLRVMMGTIPIHTMTFTTDEFDSRVDILWDKENPFLKRRENEQAVE